MSRTLAQTRQMVIVAMGEPLSTTEIDAAINEAIASIQDSLFIQLAPVTASTVDNTYEYLLGADIVLIIGVDIAGEPIPAYAWDIVEGTTVYLRLSQVYFPDLSATPTYRVHGFGFQAFVSAVGDPISVDVDYVVAQAASILHASRLHMVTSEPEAQGLIALHEQEQAKFSTLAQVARQRALEAQAIPPTARRVRSNMLV